jgi:hypothetical protein
VHFSQGKGAWLLDLRHTDDAGQTVTGVRVRKGDLTGDGKPELVFGFRISGSGAILAYDIVVDSAGGDPRVAASRELSHGQATVAAPVVNDREAKYPPSTSRSPHRAGPARTGPRAAEGAPAVARPAWRRPPLAELFARRGLVTRVGGRAGPERVGRYLWVRTAPAAPGRARPARRGLRTPAPRRRATG